MTDSAEAPRRQAAVVIPIYANAPHEVVFVERASHLRRHAGQIAFPGGAVDDEDDGDLQRTALREVHEEIGISRAALTIVGELEMVRQQRNIFNVTTFIGIVTPGTPLVIDYNEAALAYRVPLAAIVEPGAVRSGVEIRENARIDSYLFDYGPMHVWGLTANILRIFVDRYHAPESPLRAAFERHLLI